MRFDIFFSICQTDVDGYMPSEKVMFRNFFDQLKLADDLRFGTAWLAETHLSCQVQKENPGAVIPHFQGEIGLNTDIFQMAQKVFGMTRHLHVGSAILNILCNGGPLARAEQVKTCLSLHGLDDTEERLLEIGFASGRFPFSNIPYGIKPRNDGERVAWPALRGMIFRQACEIFLRGIRGDRFASSELEPMIMTRSDFRSDGDWQQVQHAHGSYEAHIEVPSFYDFPKVGVIPFDPPLHLLRLTIGAHDARTQDWANRFYPCGVFNLSITPADQIEATHERMKQTFHPDGGAWCRDFMPRTVLVFLEDDAGLSEAERNRRAHDRAEHALANYWKAMQGTLDPVKVEAAVNNALVGSPDAVIEQMKTRFHEDDRLMLWFDFNNHDNEAVKRAMRVFMERIAPQFS